MIHKPITVEYVESIERELKIVKQKLVSADTKIIQLEQKCSKMHRKIIRGRKRKRT